MPTEVEDQYSISEKAELVLVVIGRFCGVQSICICLCKSVDESPTGLINTCVFPVTILFSERGPDPTNAGRYDRPHWGKVGHFWSTLRILCIPFHFLTRPTR